jgi:hypothetical protein
MFGGCLIWTCDELGWVAFLSGEERDASSLPLCGKHAVPFADFQFATLFRSVLFLLLFDTDWMAKECDVYNVF